ncbi:MAG: hypothetical protein V2A77_04545 [Pseudomonadota bacterium]
MTLEDQIALVKRYVKRTVGDAVIREYIEIARDRAQDAHDFRWAEASWDIDLNTVADGKYDLPSGEDHTCRKLEGVGIVSSDASYRPLKRLVKGRLPQLNRTGDAADYPTHWRVWAGKLELQPATDTSAMTGQLRLEGYRKLRMPALDTAEDVLTTGKWYFYVAAMAAAYVWDELLSRPDISQMWSDKALMHLKEAATADTVDEELAGDSPVMEMP